MFEIFELCNDICNKLIKDIGLDQITWQKIFLIYAIICKNFWSNKILSLSSFQISKIYHDVLMEIYEYIYSTSGTSAQVVKVTENHNCRNYKNVKWKMERWFWSDG